MRKTILYVLFTLLGAGLFASGVYFIKTLEEPQGMWRALPYICVGLGCVILGHGIGKVVEQLAMKNNSVAAKQFEIDQKDERNIAIANRAKAKAYDMMIHVFGALIVAIALMGTDLMVVLLLALSFMFILGYSTYYRYKYDKEM